MLGGGLRIRCRSAQKDCAEKGDPGLGDPDLGDPGLGDPGLGDQRLHASPPARSASGGRLGDPDPRPPSMRLYHAIRAAVAHMIRIPAMLLMICIGMPPLISTVTKCAANARNTPRQK